MKIFIFVLITLIFATNVMAGDSIGIGIRDGIATDHDSNNFTEVFADIYLNQLISIGAAAAYIMPVRDHINSIRRNESVPITALFKLHAPIPYLQPYIGLGEALELRDKYVPTGTPVAVAGVDFPLGPLFLNIEYRRQFNDMLDLVSGGVGIKF